MQFEYDPNKSASNKIKHGIDFDEAMELWENTTAMVPSRVVGDEKRYIVMGVIAGKNWTAAITFRGENIRIISVRRSRKSEVDFYEQHQ